MLQLSLFEESFRWLLVNDGKRVKLLEEALPDFVVLILKELLELAIVRQCQILGFRHVSLHEAVQEIGALLQMGVSAILHDFHELLLEKGLGLWRPLEEKLEDADEKCAGQLAIVHLFTLLSHLLKDVWGIFDVLAELAQDPNEGDLALVLNDLVGLDFADERHEVVYEVRVLSEDILKHLDSLSGHIGDLEAEEVLELAGDGL